MRWKITQDWKCFSYSKRCKKYWERKSISSKKAAKIFRNAENFIDIEECTKTLSLLNTLYADVKIPAKGPAYLRRASSEYVERSPLHFVLWFELFSSSKHITSNWLGCMYGARRREMAPSLAAVTGQKSTKVFYHQSEARSTPTVWNCTFKNLVPRGSSSRSLVFFSGIFFSPVLDIFSPPLTSPGSGKIRDPTILGSQTFLDPKTIREVFNKRGLFSHVYFSLFLFSVPWYFLAWLEPPSTHSLIYFLLCNRHWLWFFVGRYLQNNQLKELPEGIFHNNTKLSSLWVDSLSNFT